MKLRSTFHFRVLAGLCIILLFAVSCSKESSRNGSADEQEMQASRVSSESDGEAEIIFNGLFDDAMGVNADVGLSGTGIFGRVSTCPDITITHSNPGTFFPVRIVLDFGVNGCVHPRDGHFRKGKIIIEYTDRLLYPGAVSTTIFDHFYFDSTKVEGMQKITNTMPAGSTINTNLSFKIDVIDAKLTRPSGNYTMWTSHKTLVQIEGRSTPLIPLDDIFKMEGNANGKVLRGNLLVVWESGIIEPLIKRFNCRWISKGRVRITRTNTPPSSPWIAVLDFGAGLCDNQATITINGVLHQITLP